MLLNGVSRNLAAEKIQDKIGYFTTVFLQPRAR